MRVRKDSLGFKIPFYNGISIVVISLASAIVLGLYAFYVATQRTEDEARYRIKTLKNMYEYFGGYLRSNLITSANEIISEHYDKDDINRENSEMILKEVETQITSKNVNLLNGGSLALVCKDGKVLGELGSEKNLEYTRVEGDEQFLKFIQNKPLRNQREFYQEVIGDSIVVRIAVYISKSDDTVVMSFRLGEEYLNVMRKVLLLDESNKFFIRSKNNYYYKENEALSSEKRKVDLNRYYKEGVIVEKVQLSDLKYYVTGFPLEDYYGNIIGELGIVKNLDKENKIKNQVLQLIFIIAIVFIIISYVVMKKLILYQLKPLSALTKVAGKIKDNKNTYLLKLIESGSYEISVLIVSLKNLIRNIEEKEADLVEKNKLLEKTNKKLKAMEHLIVNLPTQETPFENISYILKGLVSKGTLNYSRGIFLRFSREKVALVGEEVYVNETLKNDISSVDNGENYRIDEEELREILKHISISCSEKDSIIIQALENKRVTFYNEKSYRYNLGDELLQGLGLDNFIILPVYSSKRDYGCIIVDNYLKDDEVFYDEVEILKLLILNLKTQFENKDLEKGRIEDERSLIIGKLAKKYTEDKDIIFDEMLEVINEINTKEIEGIENIDELEERIRNERDTIKLLNDYGTLTRLSLKKTRLNTLLDEVYLNWKDRMKRSGIELSLYIKSNIDIMCDREEMKKVVDELLKNAVKSLDEKKGGEKKINIIGKINESTGKIILSVIDTGIGIPEEKVKKLGTVYLDEETNTTGLGLANAFKIIEKHRGVIKIYSTPNLMTEVKITLNQE